MVDHSIAKKRVNINKSNTNKLLRPGLMFSFFYLNPSDHTVASLVHVKNKAPSWRRRSIRPKVKDLISCDNESPFRGQLFKSFSGLNSRIIGM